MRPPSHGNHGIGAGMTLLDRLKVLVERYLVVVRAVPCLETVGGVDGGEGVDDVGVCGGVEGGGVHSLAVFIAAIG